MAHDTLQRYLFDTASARGELVQLSRSFQELTSSKDYPAPVKNLLGELMVATCLLTATLKFEGSITVQIQGDGPVSLVVINGNNDQIMRGTARWKEELPSSNDLKALVGNGHIVITIEPKKGERYQGIVGLDGDTLASCLEDYFAQSEQLKTRLWLRAGEIKSGAVAAGLLLQILPDDKDKSDEFAHLVQLTETIKDEELFTLEAQDVLHRLYHQEDITIYPAKDVSFKCSCSRERSASAIAALPRNEIDEIIEESGSIKLLCEYCGEEHEFTSADISALFDKTDSNSSPSL